MDREGVIIQLTGAEAMALLGAEIGQACESVRAYNCKHWEPGEYDLTDIIKQRRADASLREATGRYIGALETLSERHKESDSLKAAQTKKRKAAQ